MKLELTAETVASACYLLLGFIAVQCAMHRRTLARVAVRAIQSHALDRFDQRLRIRSTQNHSKSNEKVLHL